jgi:uncharacterized membrane protein YwaF
VYEPSTITDEIDRAILKASDPDLGYRQRKELKRQLRYYTTHKDMPESVVRRCQTALQQVVEMRPGRDRFVDQFLLPVLVGVVLLVISVYLGPKIKDVTESQAKSVAVKNTQNQSGQPK